MENTSGQGKNAIVPPEIEGWNWGAFLLNWIWGLGNDTLFGLLMFVPCANFVVPFILGAKGNAWAWQNRRWQSVEQFQATQRRWAKWGLGLVIASVCAAVGAGFLAFNMVKTSDAYQLSLIQVNAHPRATALLGSPISGGVPMGKIEVTGPSGEAKLSFSVEGPNGDGTVFVDATKDMGRWHLDRLELESKQFGQRVNLLEL